VRTPQQLQCADLDRLIQLLLAEGYLCVGPTVRDGAIIYGELRGIADLPRGWTDRQAAGQYRLERRADAALFGFNVGPQSWKQYLLPPSERLWRMARDPGDFIATDAPAEPPRHAFLGVRGCELAALGIHDRVLGGESQGDARYRARRDAALVIAVNCTQAGGTCFCTSMNTGPGVDHGYDIVLTELLEPQHCFVAEAGSERGEALLVRLDCPPAEARQQQAAQQRVGQAAAQMGRALDTQDLPALLLRQLESSHWETVGARCLACANCTLVCPTCFCHTVEDVADLDGQHAERWRHWDSCFNPGFSYLHGGEIRSDTAARYRQWLTHKLATWHEQFGSSGCVGCGRCIAWCPVGIDLTAEAAQLRAQEAAS